MSNFKITYTRHGDYLLQDLIASDNRKYQIGKYGMLRKSFLKEHHRPIYSVMLMNGTLFKHLEETDKICTEHLNSMMKQMKEQENVTEQLKSENPMEWVGRMNSIKARINEFLYKEYVYGGFGE